MRGAALEDARGKLLLMFLQRIQDPTVEVGKEFAFPGHWQLNEVCAIERYIRYAPSQRTTLSHHLDLFCSVPGWWDESLALSSPSWCRASGASYGREQAWIHPRLPLKKTTP
jgi:hypothetical protein